MQKTAWFRELLTAAHHRAYQATWTAVVVSLSALAAANRHPTANRRRIASAANGRFALLPPGHSTPCGLPTLSHKNKTKWPKCLFENFSLYSRVKYMVFRLLHKNLIFFSCVAIKWRERSVLGQLGRRAGHSSSLLSIWQVEGGAIVPTNWRDS
jgi:hypothetical protein